MENFIFCAVRLLKAGWRGANENWFLIFSNQCFHYNFQLDYHSYGYLHFLLGCCFTGTCYCYSHFVVFNKGSHLKSHNEAVTLRLQEDGNLVLSCLNSPIWSSGTHENADIKSLVFQENGNLALIKDDTNVAWSTNIHDSKGTYFVVQNDGNFALFSKNNLPLWASNTVEKCEAAGPEESTSCIFKSLILFLTFCKQRIVLQEFLESTWVNPPNAVNENSNSFASI